MLFCIIWLFLLHQMWHWICWDNGVFLFICRVIQSTCKFIVSCLRVGIFVNILFFSFSNACIVFFIISSNSCFSFFRSVFLQTLYLHIISRAMKIDLSKVLLEECIQSWILSDKVYCTSKFKQKKHKLDQISLDQPFNLLM